MDAESILRTLLDAVAAEQNYQPHDLALKPITSGGANYTSALFLATISAPDRDDLNLFAKVAIIGELMRKQMNGDRLFSCERFVYTELVPAYEALQNKHAITGRDRFVFPKFYAYKDSFLQETIVLENLIANGWSPFNRFKSYDWEYASSAVRELAKWHALSFAYQEDEPETFEHILEERKFTLPEQPEGEENPWMKMMTGALQVLDDEQRSKLTKFLETNATPEQFQKYYLPRGKPVLTHGDYRPSNLLARKEEGHLKIMPVDYQTVHAGAPTTDLIYFIFSGSDKSFRDLHYQRLIDHYYRQLELALKRLGLDAATVYPRQQFDEEYAASLNFGMLIGVFILPIITVEAENAPKFDGGMEDIVPPKPNELYAERFTGIFENFVEWGLL